MSEHQRDIQLHSLGRGTFAPAIALFAALNFLSKIHYILVKGRDVFVNQDKLDEYQKIVTKIKEIEGLKWKEAKEFVHKPRLGDINETKAFICLIKNCPIDFGLDTEDSSKIQSVWHTYRNKLTHLISMAGSQLAGQMLTTTWITPSEEGMYIENLNFFRNRIKTYKPFDIPLQGTKETFKQKTDIPSAVLQSILKDQCHVDRLTIAVDMTIDWLVKMLRENEYSDENCIAAIEWISEELKPID